MWDLACVIVYVMNRLNEVSADLNSSTVTLYSQMSPVSFKIDCSQNYATNDPLHLNLLYIQFETICVDHTSSGGKS